MQQCMILLRAPFVLSPGHPRPVFVNLGTAGDIPTRDCCKGFTNAGELCKAFKH